MPVGDGANRVLAGESGSRFRLFATLAFPRLWAFCAPTIWACWSDRSDALGHGQAGYGRRDPVYGFLGDVHDADSVGDPGGGTLPDKRCVICT